MHRDNANAVNISDLSSIYLQLPDLLTCTVMQLKKNSFFSYISRFALNLHTWNQNHTEAGYYLSLVSHRRLCRSWVHL